MNTSTPTETPGWIAWNGGECPVGPATLVNIRTADADHWWESSPAPAGAFSGDDGWPDWWTGERCHDWRIIAYRIVEPGK